MKPLEIDVSRYGEPEGILENIRYALSLELEDLQVGLVRHDGIFSIVGSGPSVVGQLYNIRKDKAKGRPICAVNGGHDFLVENGITPDIFLTVDPRAMTGREPRPHVNNIKYPQEQTIYAIASRCHPTTFDHLKGHKVIRWHCWGSEDEHEACGKQMFVGGGTTSGLRAINFGYIQGFRQFHLYGLDSCLGERKEKRWNTEPLPKAVETIDIRCGDRIFTCNMAMAAQANEFQNIYDVMPDITVRSFGDGLITWILEERRKGGMKT